MRTLRVLLPILLAAGAGCSTHHGYDDNQIVFGISQSVDADTGETVTTAGYDLLELGRSGWRTTGWIDRDRSCWVESLDRRLGRPIVEGGAATFRGGLLPPEGLTVTAATAAGGDPGDPELRGSPGWRTGDVLTFDARGFAMPRVEGLQMRAPSTDLEITEPPAGELTIDKAADLPVAWSLGERGRERVVVSLEIEAEEGRGHQLRCFFDRFDGQSTIPASLLARLAAAAGEGPHKGHLHMGTHRQVTVQSAGGWVIYVVASVVTREQPFTM